MLRRILQHKPEDGSLNKFSSNLPVRARLCRRLEEEGVEVFLGVDVLNVGPESVVVQDNTVAPSAVASVTLGETSGPQDGNVVTPKKTAISADLVIWTAGATVNRLVAQLAESLAKDGRGKVQTDRFLRAKSDLDIFVLGDNAVVSGKPYTRDCSHL
jgi:NADH dehydrogenase FAD-containing subunit